MAPIWNKFSGVFKRKYTGKNPYASLLCFLHVLKLVSYENWRLAAHLSIDKTGKWL